MRFRPQQVLFGVHFGHEGANRGYAFFRMPLMFDNEVPSDINLVRLEVLEHHKVPNEHDPAEEKRCDGYVLKDESGRVLHNQYPRASYGQLSDESDRRFSLRVDTAEEIEQLRAADPKVIFEYHLLEDVVERMERGIKDLSAIDPQEKSYAYCQEKAELLTGLRDRVLQVFAERYPQYRLEMRWTRAFEGSSLMRPDVSITAAETSSTSSLP